jgi:aminoglycoside 6-adenylyltransferase
MQDAAQPDPIIAQIVAWVERRPDVRAALLTSTRAVPGASVDALSDYDLVLVADSIEPFAADRSWVNDFGELLVVYWDPVHPAPGYEIDQIGNVIQYASGLKIDFTVWPVELLERIAADPALPEELDAGYLVLVDKDGLAARLQPPTYRAFIPTPPSAAQFHSWVEDFFSDVPYVAKCLWRDELLPAKWCLDTDMKHTYLRQMLEWRVAADHGWAIAVGSLGKGLKKRLPPEVWRQLEQCYAGAGLEENWAALFETIALFRQTAIAVGAPLGYDYPHELDQRVTAYAQQIRDMGPNNGHGSS